MNDSPLKYPELIEPWARTADLVLASGAADKIDPADFSDETYDFAVERMLVLESTLRDPAADPGADTICIGRIDGRYWIRNCETDSLPEIPVSAWDDARLDRTFPAIGGVQEPDDVAILGMNLRRTPLIVPVNGILRCQWENPTITAVKTVPAGTLHIAASCKGRQSREPTWLYLPVSFQASAGGGVAGPTSTQGYQDSSKNRLQEELELYDLRMWLDGSYGLVNNWGRDTRVLRHLRVRPVIEPGKVCLSPASDLLPVVAYGVDRQLDHSVATVDWSDDPVFLKANNGIGFRFTNNSPYTTRITVVLWGRRPKM